MARAACVSAVPIVAVAAVSQTVVVVTILAFRTNTRQPRSLTVPNGIACRGLAIVSPDAENENGADQWNHPDEDQLQRFLGGTVDSGLHEANGRDEI